MPAEARAKASGRASSERPANAPEQPPVTPSGAARTAAAWGALLVGFGVALGAFGAHTLSDLVTPARLATFETGVRYQVYQGLGLLALAALSPRGHVAARAAPLLVAGAIVFSGALYALVAGAPGWLGAVAPVGGALMIAGWAVTAYTLLRKPEARG